MHEQARSEQPAAAAAGATGRVRAVDAFRAFALTMVVVGHWLAFALVEQDGALTGRHLQQVWPPGDYLTWVFQVMPVFFLVGGYGNAASWTRRRGATTTLSWVGTRLWRLLVPAAVLLVAVTAAVTVLRLVLADTDLVDLAVTQVGIPLWFLAVYVAVVPMTPALVAAVDRRGLHVPVALLGAALVADVLFVHLGVPLVGYLNYLFFWVGVYALGVTWRRGALSRRPPVPALLAGGGLLAAVLLVWWGPYPVSMLAAQGEVVQNNGPPSAALVSLALAQTGVVLALQPSVERWCERRRVWAAVVRVNSVAMTMYLWHMVAALGAAMLFWALGLVQRAEPATPQWWMWRPVWYLTCLALLLALIAVFGRFEQLPVAVEPGRTTTPARTAGVVLGVLLICAGMVQLAINGLGAGPAGLPVLGLLGFGAGAALLATTTGVRPTPGRGRASLPR